MQEYFNPEVKTLIEESNNRKLTQEETLILLKELVYQLNELDSMFDTAWKHLDKLEKLNELR